MINESQIHSLFFSFLSFSRLLISFYFSMLFSHLLYAKKSTRIYFAYKKPISFERENVFFPVAAFRRKEEVTELLVFTRWDFFVAC